MTAVTSRKNNALGLVLSLLRTRDRFEAELVAACSEKGYAEQEILSALNFVKGKGWVDDESLAQRLAGELSDLKGFGPSRIREELKSRRAPMSAIERAISDIGDEILHAKKTARELKRKGVSDPCRLARRLVYLGYSEEAIEMATGVSKLSDS
jgi:SOS response regulatory protein OraA/RecX